MELRLINVNFEMSTFRISIEPNSSLSVKFLT